MTSNDDLAKFLNEQMSKSTHKEGFVIGGMLLMQCGCTYQWVDNGWVKTILCNEETDDQKGFIPP